MEQSFYKEDDEDNFVEELDAAVQWELQGTPWEEPAEQLDETTLLEDRIAFYQQLRKAEALPDEASFFLVAWAIEEMAQERAQILHDQQYATRFNELEAKYQIDADTLEEGAAVPEEYSALTIEFTQAVKALLVATFQAFGEHKMAALYRTQPDDFDRRYDAGYAFFFGEEEEEGDFLGPMEFHD